MRIMDDPYPETPGQRERALDSIREQIESWPDVPPEFKEIAKSRTESFLLRRKEQAPPNLKFYGGQLGWTHWVIKDDDLKLLGQLGPAAMAIVTFAAVPTAPFAVMAFGLALSMIGIAREFKAKSVIVDPEDYFVLMTLKQAGPSNLDQISEMLSGLHIYGSGVWDQPRTLHALNKLKQVAQRNGTSTALVNELSDGRWSTSGI